MKNLELCQLTREIIADNFDNVKYVGYTNSFIYVVKNGNLIVYDIESGAALHHFEEHTPNHLTSFEILTIENILWYGADDHFVCVKTCDNTLTKIQHHSQIVAASWNPSQDSIAIVSTDGEIGVYSVDFEEEYLVPVETSHLNNEITRKEFVAVGWGSVNTQFRGTAGKLSSTKEPEEPIIVKDDKRPRISWRGNGEMFAVNYYGDDGRRKFKVFQYPCEPIYESEHVIGLQPAIAWSPEGNKIATVVWNSKKCDLTIFEKNGLFRSSFNLSKQEHVEEIKWSPSGEIVAVWQVNSNNNSTIDLYTVKNYVWYLKQRLDFQSDNPLIHFEFVNASSSICILRVTTKCETIIYTLKFVVNYSLISYHNQGLVCASINGADVYLTQCKDGIRPPPMCDKIVTAQNPVSFIFFNEEKSKFATVDCKNLLTAYEIVDINSVEVLGSCKLKSKSCLLPLQFHHFLWKSNNEIVCIGEGENNENFLFEIRIDDNNTIQLNRLNFEIPNGINHLEFLNEIFVFQSDNCISKLRLNGGLEEMFTLPSSSLYVKSICVNDEVRVFSLTSSYKLYLDDHEVLVGVISFIIHDKYLLLTTQQSTLMCVRLNDESLREFTKLNFDNVYVRSIEQGSYLLFGIPDTSYVVMQLPRGNLEICACRMISLDRIELLIQEQKWNLALDLARIEKLNMGVLVDLDVDRFIKNVDKFVVSVNSPPIINDFLLGLQEENVFNNLYKNCNINASQQVSNKCELIGNTIIEYMEKYNYVNYISTIIIACFVKNSPSSVQEALQHIRNLLHSSPIATAEEALKNVNTLKPNAEIYQTALGMYDLDLALFIARNTQMDPKEFEPFINNLKNVDDVTCRFKINDFLRRYDVAVKYLVRCSQDKNEILEYMKEHSVYKSAYECLHLGSSLFKDVTEMYAEFLSKQKLHDEAATLYARALFNKKACEEYKKALLWEQSIDMMLKENMHVTERNEHLYDLINDLKKHGRILEACEIYEKHINDYESAIMLLVENKLFSQAVRLAQKYKRSDIYDSDINTALHEYCNDLSSKFQSMQETFTKYKTRLSKIRIEKAEKLNLDAIAVYNGYLNSKIMNYEDDICSIADTVATTASIRSTSSRSSTMSSRNRRKEERKKQDLREGGLYEDIALMKALHEIINEAFQLGPQIRQLCLSVISCNYNVPSSIKLIHNLLLSLQENMKDGIKDIWPANINNIKAMEDPNAPIVFQNIDLLDVKYRAPPDSLNTSWKLALF